MKELKEELARKTKVNINAVKKWEVFLFGFPGFLIPLLHDDTVLDDYRNEDGLHLIVVEPSDRDLRFKNPFTKKEKNITIWSDKTRLLVRGTKENFRISTLSAKKETGQPQPFKVKKRFGIITVKEGENRARIVEFQEYSIERDCSIRIVTDEVNEGDFHVYMVPAEGETNQEQLIKAYNTETYDEKDKITTKEWHKIYADYIKAGGKVATGIGALMTAGAGVAALAGAGPLVGAAAGGAMAAAAGVGPVVEAAAGGAMAAVDAANGSAGAAE